MDGDGVGDIQGTRRGDFGQSIALKRPVLDVIIERIPATLLLAVPAILKVEGLRHSR